MKHIEALGICVESAMAQHQQFKPHEQFDRGGEINQVTAMLRHLPSGLLKVVRSGMAKDRLPLKGGFKNWLPESYGSEAVIQLNWQRQGVALKVFRPSNDIEQQLALYKRNQAVMKKYFGQLLVPTSFFVFSSSYGRVGRPLVGAIQPYIQGRDLFDPASSPNAIQVIQFHEGLQAIGESYGIYPDIDGYRNVLVDGVGNINIVDVGIETACEVAQTPRMQQTIEKVAMLAEEAYMVTSGSKEKPRGVSV